MQYALDMASAGAAGALHAMGELAHIAEESGWDGSCMYKQRGHWMQPEDVRALRERVIHRRGTANGYEISVGGAPRWEDESKQRAYLESVAAEGVTWWHEYIPPDVGDFAVQRKLIERGPLRID